MILPLFGVKTLLKLSYPQCSWDSERLHSKSPQEFKKSNKLGTNLEVFKLEKAGVILQDLKEESLFPSMEVIFDFWKDSLPEASGWEFTDIWVVILAVFSVKLQGLTWELKNLTKK